MAVVVQADVIRVVDDSSTVSGVLKNKQLGFELDNQNRMILNHPSGYMHWTPDEKYISATRIYNGSISDAEFSYLDGVSGNIQDQLDECITVTGTLTSGYVPKAIDENTIADGPIDCTVVGSYTAIGIPSVNVIASVMGKNSTRLLSVCEDVYGGVYGPGEQRDIAVLSNPDNAASMTNTRTALALSQMAYDATTPEPRIAARIVAGTEGNWTVADDNTIDSYVAIETVKNRTTQQQVKINSDGEMFIEGCTKQVACGGGATGAPVAASMSVTVEIAGQPYYVNVAPVV